MTVIKNRAAFAQHASPEAVAAVLREAEAVAARAQGEVRWLAKLLVEKTADSRHAHVCVSCSDGIQPGAGCINCRNTGMDQTPCQAEGHQPQCPHGCCERIIAGWKEADKQPN
ncbi:hypothetical protein ACIA5D_36960 [Actinoplanes sp. NPDC051513]|uniref:hypothetical protein n=1 Tax=Actinoplanes sp. NPDC051513 TaxID=3363908 RepID=UPI0037AD717C